MAYGNPTHPLENVLSEGIKRCFEKFDDVEHLSEFFLFPHYCSSLNINVYYQKVFFGTVKIGGYQLERIAAGETDVLYLPSEKVWGGIKVDDPMVKAIGSLESLNQYCRFCSSVNSAIESKDPGIEHLDDDVYRRWKEGIGHEISRIQADLFEAVDTLCPQTNPAVTILHQIEDDFALIPDAADASELATALEIVQSYILSSYLSDGQIDQL